MVVKMNKSKEEQMLVELQKNLNSKFLLRMLKRCWKKNHSLHSIGNIIGEVYIHHIIHKDGYGFKYYMKKIESLYQQRKENQMTSNEYYYQRARNIALVIGRKLGIKAKNPSQADREKIKIYFLEEFVAQGYVSHSFPAGYFDSIIKNGLTVNDTIRMYKKGKIKMYKIVHDISPRVHSFVILWSEDWR